MKFETKRFDALSNNELYRIMQLRSEVFVVEQNCAYLDQDDFDQKALHVLGKIEDKIEAYTRIVPAGLIYDKYVSIGRVVSSHAIRGKGHGRPLMLQSIKESKKNFPEVSIKISAQSYIKKFYESLGFQAIGDEYLEDGIPHMAMFLS